MHDASKCIQNFKTIVRSNKSPSVTKATYITEVIFGFAQEELQPLPKEKGSLLTNRKKRLQSAYAHTLKEGPIGKVNNGTKINTKI